MSELGPEFSMFISTFHYGSLTTPNWIIPSLDAFTESLIQEQYKMIHMGALRASPNKALLACETRNVQGIRKQKGKDKINTDFEPKYEFDPTLESSCSRKNKHQKGKCSYCKKVLLLQPLPQTFYILGPLLPFFIFTLVSQIR